MALSSERYSMFADEPASDVNISRMALGMCHLAEVIKLDDVEALREFIVLKPGLLRWCFPELRIPPPIIYAARLGHNDVLKVLLDYQDTLPPSEIPAPTHYHLYYMPPETANVANNHYYGLDCRVWPTPLTSACAHARLSTVQLLLDRFPELDLEERDDVDGRTALQSALEGFANDPTETKPARQQIVKLLLDHGANATSKWLHNWLDEEATLSSISVAVRWANSQVLSWLADAGVSIHAPGEYQEWNASPKTLRTPLATACFHHNSLAVQGLFDLGARVDVVKTNELGMLPLHFAAQNWRSERTNVIEGLKTVSLLLRDEAIRATTINAQDKHGNTPMHYAAETGYIVLMRYLLDRGADPTICNRKGRTPLHQLHVLGLGCRYESPESYWENSRRESLITALLRSPADHFQTKEDESRTMSTRINQQDADGNTALHLAAESTLPECELEALVRCGARADTRNTVGETPVHLAARAIWSGRPEAFARQDRVLSLLVDSAGGDLDAVTDIGETARSILEWIRAERRRPPKPPDPIWGAASPGFDYSALDGVEHEEPIHGEPLRCHTDR